MKEQNVNHPGLFETGGKDIGFGLGLLLNHVDSGNGRKARSGAWNAAAKTYFCIDPKPGVAVSAAQHALCGLLTLDRACAARTFWRTIPTR